MTSEASATTGAHFGAGIRVSACRATRATSCSDLDTPTSGVRTANVVNSAYSFSGSSWATATHRGTEQPRCTNILSNAAGTPATNSAQSGVRDRIDRQQHRVVAPHQQLGPYVAGFAGLQFSS